MYTYIPKGVCSKKISFDVKDNKIFNVSFVGGCNGNLQGISKLVEGMNINDVSKKLKGISCNGKGTSCPDQLAQAVQEFIPKK
ncbi:TIGR03905 family TSCPD domain-containing protein [Clostridium fermenticellae]|uniref:ribonucleoside-diphosphate reductase n=1 Tax=Clostridium fermenticellae TaxID=2068654 RepID=A0A386H231_9CLOT|nr:TIGR03905 family TSCPD domain-containing protein [Clostridium fermenticellae]AYD39757.1 TIGR03905 family TSCPD domain-containing protein [Clostridium fermenticellae]